MTNANIRPANYVTLLFSLLTICLLPLAALSVPLDYLQKGISLEPEGSSSVRLPAAGEREFVLDSVAAFSFGSNHGSDCWGYIAPGGDQYAIMGIDAGVVFVNVNTLTVVDTIPNVGSSCIWQDMKTIGHYCYSVSECGNGLMVMDMSFLPDSVHFVGSFPTTPTGGTSSHNLAIDSSRGFLYMEGGSTANESINIYDISDRENPIHVGNFGPPGGIHDLVVENDTAWTSDGNNPHFSIWDVSNKAQPQRLVRVTIPTEGYSHNIWPTADRRHVVTTEETVGITVKVWNVENYSDVRLVGEYLAADGLAHNALIRDNLVYLSHYTDGISVLDISAPHCPREVAIYNLPDDDCWGVFPFTSDSLVFGSNLDGRLFILRLQRDPAWVPDTDSDADGIGDLCDNCTAESNSDQTDGDFDGWGDVCDNCPVLANGSQNDSDADGVGDVCDVCPGFDDNADSDADGIADGCDLCAGFDDFADSDADGVPDGCDACPGFDDLADADTDGIADGCDVCPGFDDLADLDADGLADGCDPCPSDPNNDSDADGWCADVDNCPDVTNGDQADSDNDNIGDACCCIGNAGNLDGSADQVVDVSDLTRMIEFLFVTFVPIGCPATAALDALPATDVGDLTVLIDHLFINFLPLPACP